GGRTPPLRLHEALERDVLHRLLEAAGRFVEARQRREAIGVAELCLLYRVLHDPNRLVVNFERHREGVTVLAAVSQREPRRIGEAARRAVDDLGNEGERKDRTWPDARRAEEIGEVFRPALPRGEERRPEALRVDVAAANVMMRGKRE